MPLEAERPRRRLSHTSRCEAQAREATDDGIKAEFLKMAKRWSHLARSYEFVEMVERFLLDAHNLMLTRRRDHPSF
jgi:hypothetical protein